MRIIIFNISFASIGAAFSVHPRKTEMPVYPTYVLHIAVVCGNAYMKDTSNPTLISVTSRSVPGETFETADA
jgi:hypothetical protein